MSLLKYLIVVISFFLFFSFSIAANQEKIEKIIKVSSSDSSVKFQNITIRYNQENTFIKDEQNEMKRDSLFESAVSKFYKATEQIDALLLKEKEEKLLRTKSKLIWPVLLILSTLTLLCTFVFKRIHPVGKSIISIILICSLILSCIHLFDLIYALKTIFP